MGRPGWTAEIRVDADLSKVPDGPVEAAKYAVDQVHRLADPIVVVTQHGDDGISSTWMVDTSDGSTTFVGITTSDVAPEDQLMARMAAEQELSIDIMPGCLVEKIDAPWLDSREVVSIGRDWLTLDILGQETERLPMDNYRAVVAADGRL